MVFKVMAQLRRVYSYDHQARQNAGDEESRRNRAAGLGDLRIVRLHGAAAALRERKRFGRKYSRLPALRRNRSRCRLYDCLKTVAVKQQRDRAIV